MALFFSATKATALKMVESHYQNAYSTFLRKEQPSVRRALPPVGWQSDTEQLGHITTVCAWENTVVMTKQPGQRTSMKKLFGL